MQQNSFSTFKRAFLLAFFLGIATPGSTQTLFDLQGLPISDEFYSESLAVSGDGTWLGGRGTASVQAWLLDSNFQSFLLGTIVAPPSGIADLSLDGTSAVGTAQSDIAFLLTAAYAVALGDLDPLVAGQSYATGISSDGLKITGSAQSPGGTLSFLEAFLFTVTNTATGAGTMVGLGDLPGGDSYSFGYGISQDGTTVVGGASSTASSAGSSFTLDFEAFRWTSGGGMQALGDLPGGGYHSIATAVSADGEVVVGNSTSTASGILDLEAFRWTQATGMQPLGDLPGGNYISEALGVSGDGKIVVGRSAVAIGDAGVDVFAPFIWDEFNGMRDLRTVFADLGLVLPNLVLTSANAISDDGLTVTGSGTSVFRTPGGDLRTEAWVGTFPESFFSAPVNIPILSPVMFGIFALILVFIVAYRYTGQRLKKI